LLAAINGADTPPRLRKVPAVAILCGVWIQIYAWDGTQPHCREVDNIGPAVQFIGSPDAPDVLKHST
jgi:hypothetical protein